ncbi:methylene-tetrahydromethanopterin reductase [Mycobacterium sp. IS-1590]|uniref:LLM class flavin-dependent oxidoreductase n=1 Tax=Mycobacterium sp. IS-1590 TaxID=1772286 RepID=UPI00074600D8|nr:LLM class flavin-dependent oxidoreductase [Mycobacterium sp. IS-1590]KUI34839.1 methylene-tetrahydromethanopterin reductase [Mycobacterium sp. IS-1590]
MKVGMHLGYQNLHGVPDVESFMEESKLAVEAEAMGFDYVGPVEHHFTDYGACPDPFQLLSWVAAQTKNINLVTAAVILPWNNPLRVVEQAIELDILSGGRLILGMGRGAARREFRSFGVELADSREMFDEAAVIIMEGVETGIVEADTKWYQIPRTEIRPGPFKSFKDRTIMVTMSPSSVDVAARFGLKALRFSQGDWRNAIPEITQYRTNFEALHNKTAPPFIISDFVCCFTDKQRVADYTDNYFARMFSTVANHYEFMSDHFKDLPSYAAWTAMGEAAAAAGGPDKAYRDYIAGNMIGTPDELVEHHRVRKEMVGDYEMLANFSWGGMPYELVYEQLKLFADKVLPDLKG